MIPSSKWFPSSLQDRAAWFENFSAQFADVAVLLGFVASDVTAVTADNAAMQLMAGAAVTLDAHADAIRQFRIVLTEGNIGDPTPLWPNDMAFGDPVTPATGIFERLDNLVKRIRVAPSYTAEIGGLLGIIPKKGDDLVADELKPSLKAAAMPGNVVQVDFVRGKTDGVQIETLIDGNGGWTSSGKFFKSPAVLNIPDGTGNPHAVQIRARYVMGNDAVGLNSDIIQVVTTP
jgi:hypothetical protein